MNHIIRIIKKYGGLSLFCIAIALILFYSVTMSSDKQKAEKGILDMTDISLRSDRTVELDGEWAFYWHMLVLGKDIQKNHLKPDLMAKVPDVWNNYKIDGKRLPGYGYATYRLKITNVAEGQELAIRMPTASTAYRLYVEDKLVASNGTVGEDDQHFSPEYRPVITSFTPESKDFDIILQVSNFSYARGGMWYSIPLGSIEAIESYNRSIIYKDMFLIGAFLTIGLFYCFVYFKQREDKASLYFVLLCICALVRVGVYGDYSINRFFPIIKYHAIVKIDYISLYWITTLYALLIGEIFPDQKSKKVLGAIVASVVIMSLLFLFSPVIVFTTITYVIEGLLVIICAYTLVCSGIAFVNKKPDSAAILLGSFAALIGGIHDVLYHNNYINSEFGEFSTFAFLVLVFIQAIILARRFKASIDDARAAELAFLHAQIKPHFLYNTINTIISVSRYDVGKSRELLGNFSSYLRRSFDFKDLNQTMPLKNEIELAQAYVDIEKARFEDELEVNFLLDTDLEIKVPILILQPIIENAVNHGVLPKEEGGIIEIVISRDSQALRFSVKDNGVGMDQEKQRSFSKLNYGSGVGLDNIDKRLKSLYGKGLSINSSLGKGTTVEWCIPLKKLE